MLVTTARIMENTAQVACSYEIWKDIVLPAANLAATVGIGVFIAVILKNKEHKAKKKELLIDSYMDYLGVWTKNYGEDMNSSTYQILKELKLSYALYFSTHPAQNLFNSLIEVRIAKLKKQIDEKHGTDHWSPFTYKFAFLLGKKVYDKHLQKLEDKIAHNYTSSTGINNVKLDVLSEISIDPIILEDINSTDASKIENALDQVEHKSVLHFNNFLSGLFNSYNTTLANLINDL